MSAEDLKKEENIKTIFPLIEKYLYKSSAGNLYQTGSQGLDRWIYNRAGNFQGMATSVPMNLLYLTLICENSMNPYKTLAMLSAMQISQKLFFKHYFYERRQEDAGS